jgi:hypothetical protein
MSDQFGDDMETQPSFTWSCDGVGSVSPSGLYTAPTTLDEDDSFTVSATADGVPGTANGGRRTGSGVFDV